MAEIEPRGPRRRLVVAAGIVAWCVMGCAMSQQAFQRLAAGVSKRNEQRYRTAEAGLRARGYVFADDEVLYAALTGAPRERCLLDAGHGTAVEKPPTDAAESILLHVSGGIRADRPAPEPIEIRVDAVDACQFFRARTNQLDGQSTGGGATRIVRIADGLRLARDQHGNIAVVAASSRVVSRRRVLVERSCDHMPSPDSDDPLVRQLPVRVVVASAPPPRIDMIVEEEVLDVECTENTY